ncbi:MAG: purine-nucleoside phosphorylase [Bacteroidia bacterium]|nr:MAG: purine-nucleoside phosphorylase [Bacteroidia bacterium]
MSILQRIDRATEALRGHLPQVPSVAVVLGSGLGGFAETITDAVRIPYGELPDFPVSTVAGHEGAFVVGRVGGRLILAMAGRFHYYEGYTMEEVTLGIRVMARLGIRTVVLSNASGGVNPAFRPGDLMLLCDHINLMPNPLIGPNLEDFGTRFPSMNAAYDPSLRALALEEAQAAGIDLCEGCYVGTTGPSFETPHEYNYFRVIGGDAVGMSTVPETIVANHSGMRVLAFSVISNVGGLRYREEVTHEEVQEVGAVAGARLSALLHRIIARL